MNEEIQSFQTHAKAAVDSGRPLFWKMESIQEHSMKSLAFQVSAVLDMINRSDLKKNFIYCLTELSVNAQKAMVKRLFFHEKAMDIENPDHYQMAIPTFRDSWAKNLPDWEKRLKEANRSFQVALICKEGFITLFVANTGKMVPVEIDRIRKSMKQAFDTDSESFDARDVGVGQDEGGGLGLFLINKMLQNAGFTSNALYFSSEGDKTVFYLRVPLFKTAKERGRIHFTLAAEIEKIPPFPEIILQIHKKIDTPDVNLDEIAELVKRDPALTANLFKTTNSAAFMRLNRVTEIRDALTVLGLKGLRMLLYAFGMEVAMGSRVNFLAVADHSYQVANIATILAKKLLPDQKDQVFAAGLLHDIGRIIILDQKSAFMDKLKGLHDLGQISDWSLENVVFGLDHAELGGLVGQRWNYPPPLVSAIRFHHEVENCPEEHRKLVEIINFADLAAKIVANEFPFYFMNPGVARTLNLANEEDMKNMAEALLKQVKSKESDTH